MALTEASSVLIQPNVRRASVKSTPLWLARVDVVPDGGAVSSVDELLKIHGPIDGAFDGGRVFVDEVLGYAIGSHDPARGGWPAGIRVLSAVRDVEFRLAVHNRLADTIRWRKSPRAALPPPPRRLRFAAAGVSTPMLESARWSAWNGSGVRVAVLDSGIAPGIVQLPRRPDHADFCNPEDPSVPTNDMGSHGTNCAGVIGARMGDGLRQSVAPDCDIYAGQVTCRSGGTYTKVSNICLLMTWAERMKARVINMSFNAEEERVLEPEHALRLGEIATRLRKQNKALVFAAAQEGGKQLCFPASAPGVVAVGMHATSYEGAVAVYGVNKSGPWQKKGDDLLFGLGDDQPTFNPDGSPGTLGDVSGACAFVSGAAALYMEKFPHYDVNRILQRMKADAVDRKDPSGRSWPTVRLPST